MFGLGIWEVVAICVVALVVLGPHQLPKMAAKIGHILRDVRRIADDLKTNLYVPNEDMLPPDGDVFEDAENINPTESAESVHKNHVSEHESSPPVEGEHRHGTK